MSFLVWILLGLIAGALAKFIMPGPDPGGWIVTILIGIAGSVIGGFLFSLLGISASGGLSLGSIVVATVGALVLLWAYRRFA